MTKEEFIIKARTIHGNKYNYSKVSFHKMSERVEINCPIHGSFFQSPTKHLLKRGCPKCAIANRAEKQRGNIDDFITAARAVHGNRYDYSKVNYINANTEVCIICPEHGEFWQKTVCSY